MPNYADRPPFYSVKLFRERNPSEPMRRGDATLFGGATSQMPWCALGLAGEVSVSASFSAVSRV